jgi:pimeloyl-ACP methyl ester carboxylesterase
MVPEIIPTLASGDRVMTKRRIFACALLLIQALVGCGGERPSSMLAARAASTRYPIVLHHGLFGFDRILFLDYFYQVKATLEHEGHVVRTMRVSPVNSMEVRAQQLAEQIDAVLEETGAGKVNIIAHSMGGSVSSSAIRRVISATGSSTPAWRPTSRRAGFDGRSDAGVPSRQHAGAPARSRGTVRGA